MSKVYKPTVAIIDADFIPYQASFGAQKTYYHFVVDDKIVSDKFPSAKLAKQWLLNEDLDAEMMDEECWVTKDDRVTTVEYGTVEEAIKACDNLIDDCLKLAGDTIETYELWLTRKGDKIKVQKGTERKYQHNRDGLEKPKHWQVVRDYLEQHKCVKLAPSHFEADNLVVVRAEKLGEEGVALSMDKDIGTLEEGWFIHMNKMMAGTPKWVNAVGELWLEGTGKKAKVRGVGFKWLMLQTIAGDTADHYNGLFNVGDKTVLELLDGLTTKPEVINAVMDFYHRTVGDNFTFISWDGVEHTLTYLELLNQHASMGYMERSSTDSFDYKNYL